MDRLPGRMPAYIPARTFALAILDLVARKELWNANKDAGSAMLKQGSQDTASTSETAPIARESAAPPAGETAPTLIDHARAELRNKNDELSKAQPAGELPVTIEGRLDKVYPIKNVDLVFDLIGGDVRFKSFPVLKPGGVISHISVPPMTQPPPRSDVEVKPAPVKYDAALLDQIGALVKSKAVRPVVSEVFAFGDALKSFEHVMTGHTRCKVMLDMTQ
jgi:hypothetical protein